MKKLLFLCLFVFMAGSGFSQYNDTLYYKSGMAKAVTVKEYDKQYIFYEYGGKKGKLVTNRITLSTLEYFVIYNEFNELVYNSLTGFKKEAEPGTEETTEPQE